LNVNELFRRFAQRASEMSGTAWAFLLAVAAIVVWMFTGPAFGFSDTWQLVINTGTTIVTFLMVFLIQNTQNRDARALQLKLDELIRTQAGARNQLVDLENLSDEELQRLQEQFQRLSGHGDAGGNALDAAIVEEVTEAIEDEQQDRQQSRHTPLAA